MNPMNQIKDLNIETEILDLFDQSLHQFTRKRILEILQNPLSSISEIKERQNILRAFIAHKQLFEEYSYTVLYLREVFHFLKSFPSETVSNSALIYRFSNSEKERSQNRSKCSVMIQLFYRLYHRYFSRLELQLFPKKYQANIQRIIRFISSFNLEEYEREIREKKLSNKSVLKLWKTLVVQNKSGKIDEFWKDFFLFESYISISKTILRENFQFPEFTENAIELDGFYHPLLENPVKNKLRLHTNVLVINGPNMSGKSTVLKSLGWCVYLGHLGLAIPADTGKIPFFDHFFIEINRKDDLIKGYSHFMMEIKELKNTIIKAKEDRCFVIFDELFSGTNIEDATEISILTFNGLTRFHSSAFLFSTHIQTLKKNLNENISSCYLETILENNHPKFTYNLKEGWTDIKVGSVLFKKEGLTELLQNHSSQSTPESKEKPRRR